MAFGSLKPRGLLTGNLATYGCGRVGALDHCNLTLPAPCGLLSTWSESQLKVLAVSAIFSELHVESCFPMTTPRNVSEVCSCAPHFARDDQCHPSPNGSFSSSRHRLRATASTPSYKGV